MSPMLTIKKISIDLFFDLIQDFCRNVVIKSTEGRVVLPVIVKEQREYIYCMGAELVPSRDSIKSDKLLNPAEG